jgi:hypothetical protein
MPKLPVGIYADTRRRITCVACQRNAQAASEKLCVECAADIPSLRAHLMATKLGYQTQTSKAWYALEEAIPDDPKSDLAIRWGN